MALLALVRRQLSHDADSVLPPSVVKARGRATLLSDWHKQKKAGKLSARPQTAHGIASKLNFSEKLDHRLAEQRAAWAPKPVTSEAVRVREALCDSSSRAIDLFRKWDADDSGTITKREWRRALPMLERELKLGGAGKAALAFRPLKLRSIGVQMRSSSAAPSASGVVESPTRDATCWLIQRRSRCDACHSLHSCCRSSAGSCSTPLPLPLRSVAAAAATSGTSSR